MRASTARLAGSARAESAGSRSSPLGKHLHALLQERFPELYAERMTAAPKKRDRRGLGAAMPLMGLHGGYFMLALADVAGGEPSVLSFAGL